MSGRRHPRTLEEAYFLRDDADDPQERNFYQERVYALRRAEYQRLGIPTDSSSRRRERRRAVEFSREVFFLEVDEISGRRSFGGGGRAREEARRHAARLDKHASIGHASPNRLASPHAVALYRRNFLELLRIGKSGGEAYYLSRVIGPVNAAEFGDALESVRRTGCPRGRPAYAVERAAVRILDLPGGMILTLLAFFVSLFAFMWASTGFWDGAGAGHPDRLRREQAHETFDVLGLLRLLQLGHPLFYGRHVAPSRFVPRGLLCGHRTSLRFACLPLPGWKVGSHSASYERHDSRLYGGTVSPRLRARRRPCGDILHGGSRPSIERARPPRTISRGRPFAFRSPAGYLRHPCDSHALQGSALSFS